MFWIILGIVWFTICIIMGIQAHDDEVGCMSILGFIPILIAAIGMAISVNVYPDLMAQRTAVMSIKSEIQSVKNSRYSEVAGGTLVGGTLVGGSLDNMEQSKTLSVYISKYAEAKARFNQDLTRAKIARTMPVLFWFGVTAGLSERINDIELIE